MIGILLVAGSGSRMKSAKPKVLFEINGRPMALGPLRVLLESCKEVIAVVGHQADHVESALKNHGQGRIKFCRQEAMRGTGDAVRTAVAAYPHLFDNSNVIVFNGDLPLIQKETLHDFTKECIKQGYQSACLSYEALNPFGLGRIIRNTLGGFERIREEVDTNEFEKTIKEVNAGVYFFNGSYLVKGIDKLTANNKKNELYLTDLLGVSHSAHSGAVLCTRVEDLMGVNNTFELSNVRRLAQARLLKKLCEDHGIEIQNIDSVYIEESVCFQGSAYLGLGTQLRGETIVGEGVRFEGATLIVDSSIGPNTVIDHGCVIRQSAIGEECKIGPMAHLRPKTTIAKGCRVGNFVELKNAKLAEGVKASHLTYLGDVEVGKEANIGCGTITCNYDGFNKHQTHIGEGAFIGSDSQLIAPVTIGKGAYIASGSTITKDVPEGALALTRPELKIKQGYAKKLAAIKRSSSKKD